MVDKFDVHILTAQGGVKAGYGGSVRLDAFTEFVTGPHDDSDGALLTVDQAYKRVPWLRRGVNLRAFAVSHMPFAIWSGDDDVTEAWSLTPYLSNLLLKTEKSLVKRGKAYWLLEANRLGKNITPRFVPAKSVTVKLDQERGLVGFIVQFSTGAQFVELERMVYFHLPNDDSETDADSAPAVAAQEAASLLYAANRTASKFYAGGMVGTSIISVPITTSDDEIKRIEGFFNRLSRGIRNAFRSLGVRAGIDIKSVGQSLRDSRVPELVAEARDDVAVALDIPPTVLDGKAANFATAQSEWFGFVTNTVIPECEWIADVINTQWLNRQGLFLEFQPGRLEVMQAVQLEQAQAVIQLVGGQGVALISVPEARALIGFPERETETDGDEEETDEDDLKINWQRAFNLARRKGKAKNPPDDELRRKHEREIERAMRGYFEDQFARIQAGLGE